jgi:hypothetical protein
MPGAVVLVSQPVTTSDGCPVNRHHVGADSDDLHVASRRSCSSPAARAADHAGRLDAGLLAGEVRGRADGFFCNEKNV